MSASDSEETRGQNPFEWQVFSDATCAGLTALIPLPLVDLLFEGVFRRRLPRTIVRHRSAEVSEATLGLLGRGEQWLSVEGCLKLPFVVLRWVLKRIWRKVIYVLAVADAAEQLSAYWHRAFLIDHAVQAGHLSPDADVEWCNTVIREVLAEADTSPLRGLGRQVATSAGRVLRLLVRARRRGTAGETRDQERVVEADWDMVERSLRKVTARYNELYPLRDDQRQGQRQPSATGAGASGSDSNQRQGQLSAGSDRNQRQGRRSATGTAAAISGSQRQQSAAALAAGAWGPLHVAPASCRHLAID